jgi:hypothetical protein
MTTWEKQNIAIDYIPLIDQKWFGLQEGCDCREADRE